MSDAKDRDRPAAVIYAAKSTKDKHGSIPTQLDDGRVMAEREGWGVVAEYRDEGFSAFSGNRGPGLAAARDHAARLAEESGEVVMLLAQHSDRFSRGGGDKPGAAEALIEIWHAERRRNVHLRSVEDDFDLKSSATVANIGERNRADSARKSRSVKGGHQRRREAGKPHGSPRPFGVEYRDGERVPCEAEVPNVRRIFNEYVSGFAQQVVSRNLNDDRVPTAKGGRWYQGTVRAILANDVYVKLGIIDQETFDKATALRKAARRTYKGGRHPAGRHLFRKGMLRCECGAPMITRTGENRKSEPYEVYICYERVQGKDRCSMPPLRRADLDETVFSFFNEVGLDIEATKARMQEAHDSRLATVQAELRSAKREAKLADEAYTRVQRDYQRGAIEADDWAEQRPQLIEERDAAMAAVDRLQAKLPEVESWTELEDAEGRTLERLAEIRKAIAGEVTDAKGVEAVRAALKKLFASFQVSIPVNGKATITPEWRRELVTMFDADGEEDYGFETKPARVPLELAGKTEANAFTT
ncbi:MAG: recombinase family protein [Solirubrobacterales bacterium]